MTLCDDGHDEVCYGVRDCPACAAVREKEVAEEEVEEVKTRLAGAQESLERAEADHLVLYRENQSLTHRIAEMAVRASMSEP